MTRCVFLDTSGRADIFMMGIKVLVGIGWEGLGRVWEILRSDGIPGID
jgi:hypothetical protein